LHPARVGSVALGVYAVGLIVLMAAYHVVATALAAVWCIVCLPATLWNALATDDEEPADDETPDDRLRPASWRQYFFAFLPYLRSSNADLTIGPLLREDDAPGIYVVLAEMARKVGVAPPDEVRLTYLPCCGVLEQRTWAGLRPGRRVLVLGLPLVYVLSVEEFRAAVAHELAHLSRGDAALAFMLSHFVDALDQSIEHGAATPWGWLNPCVVFAWLVRGAFRVLSSPLARYQEYRADAVAASVCGGDVAANSLRNAALVQPIFKEVLCDYHPVVIADANLYQFFRAAWDAIADPLKEEIKESLVHEERAAFFSVHPTLRVRLRRLDRFASHREPDTRPARRLFARRRELEGILHDYIYRRRTPQLTVFRPASRVATSRAFVPMVRIAQTRHRFDFPTPARLPNRPRS
jgi:Zn-dependent protease with chaperone function